jgi:DHA2 family multidrug resistance protein
MAASPNRLFITCGVMIAAAMQVADALIVNVALPQVQEDLQAGIELGGWVMTGYLCATAVAAPLTGWLRARYRADRLFPAAVGAFVIASLLCAAAPSASALILFRVLQGAGGGIIIPLSQAIILDIYPKEQHGRMLAILGAAVMTGPILGPVLGGIITDLASWRWVFAINLPLGLLSILATLGLRSTPEPAPARALDGIGIVLLMVTVGATELSLERGVGRFWTHSGEVLAEGTLAITAFAAMLLRARQSSFSVFDLDIFKDVNFAVGAFYHFMISGLLFVAVVFLPALGEGPLGYSATLSGLTIVPRAVLMMLVMLVVGEIIGKISYRLLLAGGWILMATGLTILSVVPPAQGVFWMMFGSSIQAIGAGILYPQVTTLTYSTLPIPLRTDAAGVYNLLRQLGFASGIAVMTAVLHTAVATNLADLAAPSTQYVDDATIAAYSQCFRMMAIASLILIPGIFLFRPGRLSASAIEPV